MDKKLRVLVVGWGNFGMFLIRHFVAAGFEVLGSNGRLPSDDDPLPAMGARRWNASEEVDVAIFAIFPKHMRGVIRRDNIALYVNVSSLQVPGIRSLSRSGIYDDQLLSMHPMFGQDSVDRTGLAGKRIVVTKEPYSPQNKSIANLLLASFEEKGVVVSRMSPEKHDQMMLPQALAFLVGELMRAAPPMDPEFLTPSGQAVLDLLKLTDGSDDLKELILSNEAFRSLLPVLRRAFDDTMRKVGSK